jgi:hypothetical protein
MKEIMIEQYAKLRGDPTEEDKNKFASYPGIKIKKHVNPTGKAHIIIFDHIQTLKALDLNVSNDWIFGVNHQVSLIIPLPFPTNTDKNG